MKVVHVSRKIYTDLSTIGDIYFDGEFICSSLEDTVRALKIPGRTAIPSGEYPLVLKWSPRYMRMMPYVLDVPFFEGVMIHWGNNEKDTAGCILAGVYDKTKPDWISSSRLLFTELYTKLEKASKDKEKISVLVTGGKNKEDFIRAKREQEGK